MAVTEADPAAGAAAGPGAGDGVGLAGTLTAGIAAGVQAGVGLAATTARAAQALPGLVLSLDRSVRALAGSLEATRDAAAALQRLAVRGDALLDELEEPLRSLVPGIRRVAPVLDHPVIDEIPATLLDVQQRLLPLLGALGATQEQVASIAVTTARITAVIDEAEARLTALAALPGAGLLRRRPREGPAGG